MINFSFSGCFGKAALNFPFVLLERIISEGKISSGRMDQVPFPGAPSLPRGPASAPSQRTSPRLAPGAPPGTGARAAATTHALFGEPGEAVGYKKVPPLTGLVLDIWRLSQDPTFPQSNRILN